MMGANDFEASSLTPDEIFHEACRVYLEHCGFGDGLLVDWMLVSAQHMITQDGSATSLSIVVSREQPVYRTAGLVQFAKTKTDAKLVR